MKKILSLALALIMVTSVVVMPSTAYAAVKAPPKTTITKIVAQPVAFKVSWKTVKKVSGYQVQYSTSKKFTKKATKSVTIKKASSKSKTVKKLKSKKKYYVRVRTYKTYKSKGETKHKYSKFSKAKTVTTKKKVITNNNTTDTTSQSNTTSGDVNIKEIPCPVNIPDDKFKEQPVMAQNIVTNKCHITSDMSDLKKLVIISKWLSTNVSYNAKVAQQDGDKNITPKPTDPDLPYKGQTAWEVFTYHSAVCGGYAQAQMYLCRAAGIECYYVIGQNQGGLHAWNLVKVEGYWYGIDCYGAGGGNFANDINQDTITIHPEYARPYVKGILSINGGCEGNNDATKKSYLDNSSQELWNLLSPKGNNETLGLLTQERLNMYEEMHNWQIG